MNRKPMKKKRSTKCDRAEARILRRVGDKEAFYFYSAFGEPTGERASSLLDFAGKIRTVKLESLRFHLQRRDFQNWIEKTIGDSELARRIRRVRPSSDEKMRKKIHAVIENHIKELLPEASIFISTTEDWAIVTPP